MKLHRFNLNLLVALDALLGARSITEAARQVCLTQPAMSVALRKLREHFDDELVIPRRDQMVLTPLAEQLKPQIRDIVRRTEDALEMETEFDPSQTRRVFRIVTTDLMERTLIREAAEAIVREAPFARIHCLPFSNRPVSEAFRDNVDLVIIPDRFVSPAYPAEQLFKETMSCVVWTGNKRVGATLTRELFNTLPHAVCLSNEELAGDPAVPAACSTPSNVAIGTSSLSALPEMVVGTQMIATTYTLYARACARYLPIRVLDSPAPQPPQTIMAQWQPYKEHDPGLQWLRAQLRAAVLRFAVREVGPAPSAQTAVA